MAIQPEELDAADVNDSAAMKDVLARAAERIRELEQDGVRAVGGTVAEMLACSKARHFVGSLRSSFSSHVVAMRAARGMPNTSTSWLRDRVPEHLNAK